MTWGQWIWAAALLFGLLAFMLMLASEEPPIRYDEILPAWLIIEFFIFAHGLRGIARRARERSDEEKRENDQIWRA
jgi:hypothetical protein